MGEARAAEQGRSQLRLRGANFLLLVLEVRDLLAPEGLAALRRKLAVAPSFFRDAPLVLDLGGLPEGGLDLPLLLKGLRAERLLPLAVRNGAAALEEAARSAGLAVLPAATNALVRELPAASAPAPGPGRILERPVRAGMRLEAGEGDLVCLSHVSPGGEVVAAGHLHVYGRLRGRALAGSGGAAGARIFARSLEAELVAIAGRWLVRDDLPEALIGRPAEVRLEGERLLVEPLKTDSHERQP